MKRLWKQKDTDWEGIFHQNAEKSLLYLLKRESNPDSIDGAFYLCGQKAPDTSVQTVYSYFFETANRDFENNSESFYHLFIEACAALIGSLFQGRNTILTVKYQHDGPWVSEHAKGRDDLPEEDSFTLLTFPYLFRGGRGADTEILKYWVEDEVRGAINDELTVYALRNDSLNSVPRDFDSLNKFLKRSKPAVFIPPKDFCHSSLEMQIDLSEISYTTLVAMAEEACHRFGKRLVIE